MPTPYLSEILKILDGALKSNATMARNYAGLLADKLEEGGERAQAQRVRERLALAPTAIARAQAAGGSIQEQPLDSESRLPTVDISQPKKGHVQIVLPSATKARVKEFLDATRHYDRLLDAGAASPLRMVMYGEPGTGKTQTARWIAAELQLSLCTVRCDTLVSSLLGQTSKNLRRVFDFVEQHPCVLFLDEFDALASARGNERDVGELQRVVISLLQNLDALPENIPVIAASNHDRLLDPAVWRRFQFRVPIPLPDEILREQLWRSMLGSYAEQDLPWKTLSQKSEGMSGAIIQQVSLDAKRHAILGNSEMLDVAQLFQKIFITKEINEGRIIANTSDEIVGLREWDNKIFTIRELSRLYSVSTRKISVLVKEPSRGDEDEDHRIT